MHADAVLTLLGTALIVAVPSTLSAVLARSTRRKVDNVHDAVQVLNGGPVEDSEPLGDYLHRRMHTLDGRFDVMIALLREIESNLQEANERNRSWSNRLRNWWFTSRR